MTWAKLEEEIRRARDAGACADFWWRDDDAVLPSDPLATLLRLSSEAAVPLALAVIPLRASAEMFPGLKASVLLHGTDHRNRAAAGEKKTEFPAEEPDDEALERLRSACARLAALAGAAFVPALAPPWNRFRRGLAARLPEIGLAGLSAFGPRPRPPLAGVAEINTHVDIVDWHGTRGFVGEDAALAAAVEHLAAKRAGAADAAEPTGWLTHHAVHDSAAWNFLERLFERTRRCGARWAGAKELFAAVDPTVR